MNDAPTSENRSVIEIRAERPDERPSATSMELHTARLRLRAWRDSDREPFARLNADPRVMQYFAAPLTVEESDQLASRIQAHLEQYGWGLWAVEVIEGAAFAGFIGLMQPRFDAHFTPCTEIGWRLAPAFWGQGYAAEGASAALAFAFDELELAEVVSLTTESNWRSRRVMERIGMTRNPADDFEHPGLPVGHVLRRHVLYRKVRSG
jgi:RimJ/RimL family protein N-acetyltransferase